MRSRTYTLLLTIFMISWIITHVHKYQETWEYDTPVCKIQTHAVQCDGHTLFF